jgi:ribose transport system permease protein
VSGIRVERVKIVALVISGGCAALGGLLYAGRLHGATYTLGDADLMTVIAAVVLGGTRLFGGSGSIIGALVGSLMMGVLNNGLILAGLTVSGQSIARSAIIIVAVALTLREEKV